MASFSVDLGGKKLLISAYAKNIVRIRVSDKFEPTLFEKYGIYRPAEDTGDLTDGGLLTGDLFVKYEGGKIVFSSNRFERAIKIGDEVARVRAYMDRKLGGLRPEYGEGHRKERGKEPPTRQSYV